MLQSAKENNEENIIFHSINHARHYVAGHDYVV
jgi:hypothetical protein